FERVETPYGSVRVKIKVLDGQAVSAKPEYDDCAGLARRLGVPLAVVLEAATAAAAPLVGSARRTTGR
ncbi:MAG: LarC family nickel insertion protein, partial [Chloroflexi bacterium]|nr:LarC family nickel insertion protein [Chloroflexota bacterium]